MKKAFKYILSAAALLMLTATAAFAQDVVANKTVTSNTDGSYTLTLEAYATGESVTTVTEESVPLDIVLVLDVSGSMDDTIHSYSYTEVSRSNADRNKTYYFLRNNRYVETTYRDENWQYVSGWFFGNRYSNIPSNAKIYERTEVGAPVKKIDALKSACELFIENVASQSNSDCQHTISIVKFAGTSSNSEGNDFYTSWGTRYNNSQIVKSLLRADTNKDLLITTIQSFSAAGGTSSDLGMNHAKTIINKIDPSRKSNKVVVMFTDGEPDSFYGNNSVANNAVSYSKNLKDAGVTVYTVGVFDNPQQRVHQYMSAVSSDKPDASIYTDGDPIIPTGDGYYMTAETPEELNDIFETISKESTEGATKSTLTATNSSVRDFVTPEFKIVGKAEDIILEVCPSDSTHTGSSPRWLAAQTASGVTANIGDADEDGNTPVIVTGFDYSANWVGPKTTNGEITGWRGKGKKLVIKIKIKVDENANTGGVLNTNTEDSGIYSGDGLEKDFESTGIEFPVPQYVEKGFAYLHIVKSGLADGTADNKSVESTIFDIKVNGVNGETIKTVMVNGKNPEAYVKVDWLTDAAKTKTFDSAHPLTKADMIKFTVVERSDWAWSNPDSESLTSELYDFNAAGSAVAHTFDFGVNGARTEVAHDEKAVIKVK